jgi:hypothetical protein
MRLVSGSLLVCISLGIALPAVRAELAQEPDAETTAPAPFETCIAPGQPSARLMRDLIDWIARHSTHDVSAVNSSLPAVTFCQTGEVIDYEGRHMVVDRSLNAAYDELARRIWLVLPWSAGNRWHVSILLHELVHDVQFQSRSWPCPQASEEEAYRLQHDWLAEQGIASGFNWFAIQMRARCPRDIHP